MNVLGNKSFTKRPGSWVELYVGPDSKQTSSSCFPAFFFPNPSLLRGTAAPFPNQQKSKFNIDYITFGSFHQHIDLAAQSQSHFETSQVMDIINRYAVYLWQKLEPQNQNQSLTLKNKERNYELHFLKSSRIFKFSTKLHAWIVIKKILSCGFFNCNFVSLRN